MYLFCKQFKYIYFFRVDEYKDENKMDSYNLSVVWGPCVFKSLQSIEAVQSGYIVKINLVLKELIDHYHNIFDDSK